MTAKLAAILLLLLLVPAAAAQTVSTKSEVTVKTGQETFDIEITVTADSDSLYKLYVEDRPGFDVQDDFKQMDLRSGDKHVFTFPVDVQDVEVKGTYVFDWRLYLNDTSAKTGQVKVSIGESSGRSVGGVDVPGLELPALLLALTVAIVYARRK